MVQTIFSADKMHPAAIYCLMLLLWYDHPKSQKHDTISLTVEDYLLTDDDSVDELLRASERGSTLNTMVHAGWAWPPGQICCHRWTTAPRP